MDKYVTIVRNCLYKQIRYSDADDGWIIRELPNKGARKNNNRSKNRDFYEQAKEQ